MTITAKTKARIKQLFEENDYKELFVNKKGELFTRENLVKMSVEKDADWEKVLRKDYVEQPVDDGENDGDGDGTGNEGEDGGDGTGQE